jgi:hypothetical protein
VEAAQDIVEMDDAINGALARAGKQEVESTGLVGRYSHHSSPKNADMLLNRARLTQWQAPCCPVWTG